MCPRFDSGLSHHFRKPASPNEKRVFCFQGTGKVSNFLPIKRPSLFGPKHLGKPDRVGRQNPLQPSKRDPIGVTDLPIFSGSAANLPSRKQSHQELHRRVNLAGRRNALPCGVEPPALRLPPRRNLPPVFRYGTDMVAANCSQGCIDGEVFNASGHFYGFHPATRERPENLRQRGAALV